jgi:hypothetical protein
VHLQASPCRRCRRNAKSSYTYVICLWHGLAYLWCRIIHRLSGVFGLPIAPPAKSVSIVASRTRRREPIDLRAPISNPQAVQTLSGRAPRASVQFTPGRTRVTFARRAVKSPRWGRMPGTNAVASPPVIPLDRRRGNVAQIKLPPPGPKGTRLTASPLLDLEQPQDHVGIVLAGAEHGRQAVDHGRLDPEMIRLDPNEYEKTVPGHRSRES